MPLALHVLEPRRSWPLVESRLAAENHPRRRRALATLLRHLRAERQGDLEGVMKTLGAHPVYRTYGASDPRMCPEGPEAVRDFYATWIAAGGDLIDYDIQRLIVDDDSLLTEGPLRMPFIGRLLLSLGYEVDDPEAHYLYEARLAVVWCIDAEGLIEGELTYTAGNGFRDIGSRKLRPEDLHRS